MARRRRKKSSRKRSRRKGMSEGTSFMSAGRKRRKGRKRRRSGFLSESFSGSRWTQAGKATGGGAVGGVAAHFINRFEMNGLTRFVANVASSLLAATVFDAPSVGAGIAGAYSMLATQQLQDGTLKEDADYADPNVLAEYPQFADANGNAMFLAEDGNLYYLDEPGQTDPLYLSENIYPNYFNAAQY